MKSPITTHVLDTALGKPAASVPVKLEREHKGSWVEEGSASTNSDGRAPDLLPVSFVLVPGTYRITFELADYFRLQSRKGFYPHASITFLVEDPQQHYHVPLLLSGFGFSTYRGS
jgi:5-hydroxyisourate hydrolase